MYCNQRNNQQHSFTHRINMIEMIKMMVMVINRMPTMSHFFSFCWGAVVGASLTSSVVKAAVRPIPVSKTQHHSRHNTHIHIHTCCLTAQFFYGMMVWGRLGKSGYCWKHRFFFTDSLPFLWKKGELVPSSVSGCHSCCQPAGLAGFHPFFSTKTPKQGKGRHSLHIGSLMPVPFVCRSCRVERPVTWCDWSGSEH